VDNDLLRLYEVGRQLGERTLDEVSSGGEVRVTVNLHGVVREVFVRPSAMRDLDLVALGELITTTAQAAQRRAREAYDEAIAAATPTDIAQWTVTTEWPESR
jgi:DNA-binding protein YbaB